MLPRPEAGATRVPRSTRRRWSECREADAPRTGDTARYEDESSGLRVEVAFESIAVEPPDPGAFRDPDAAPPAEGARVTAIGIVAFGAVSGLGEGAGAAPAGEPGARRAGWRSPATTSS